MSRYRKNSQEGIVWALCSLSLAIVALVFAILSASSEAAELELGMGHGYTNSEGNNTHILGLRAGGRWLLQYEKFGGRKFVTSNQATVAHQWTFRKGRAIQPFLRLGVSYNDRLINDPHDDPEIGYAWTDNPVIIDPGNAPLVSDKFTHYLGGGVYLGRHLALGVAHNSTGGQSGRNQGLDRVYMTLRVPL